MNRYIRPMAWALACTALAAFVSPARANDAVASDSAIVQPGGPESGTNGKKFFDVEGRNVPNGSVNAAYGVIEFNSADFNYQNPVTRVASLIVTLTQSLASFTSRGSMVF